MTQEAWKPIGFALSDLHGDKFYFFTIEERRSGKRKTVTMKPLWVWVGTQIVAYKPTPTTWNAKKPAPFMGKAEVVTITRRTKTS